MKQRHPHDPLSPTGHSVSCPCHQLCWVQLGGTRPPAEEVQRRVVGHHRKVNRAAQGQVLLSAQASAPRTKRQVLGACTSALCVRVCEELCSRVPVFARRARCHAVPRCRILPCGAWPRCVPHPARASPHHAPCACSARLCACARISQCGAGCHNLCPEGACHAVPRCRFLLGGM